MRGRRRVDKIGFCRSVIKGDGFGFDMFCWVGSSIFGIFFLSFFGGVIGRVWGGVGVKFFFGSLVLVFNGGGLGGRCRYSCRCRVGLFEF